ncbi:MAG: hypothetical protein HYT98_01995 [Candidatus Sungbacteria bacterium]|nr:hypothetical protein [Candidatus Sungbacteria bacterium]
MPRIYKRRPLLSNEEGVKRLAKRLTRTLKKKIDAIYVKKILRDPDKPHKDLYGLLVDNKIYLGKRKHQKTKTPLVMTLIHELIHEAFPSMPEKIVLNTERKLYRCLAETEKLRLKKYINIFKAQIPTHEIKHTPPR